MLSNQDIAQVFLNIADMLEIQGENRFKFLAYRRAGEVIADLNASVAELAAADRLEELPGIGPAIKTKIQELLQNGKLNFYEQLQEQVPLSVLELLKVPEIGPKTAQRLYQELSITTLQQLREAAEAGKIRGLKGLGRKTEERILQGLNSLEQWGRRTLLAEALPIARELIAALRLAAPTLTDVAPAGSLRRARPTIGDIDLLAAAHNPGAVIDVFIGLPHVARVESHGERKATVLLHNGYYVDLLVIEPERWGSGLQHFTGSKEHNIQFRELAQQRKLSFSEYGFRRADGSEIPCASEEEVYALLDLPWIPPELRESWGEFEAARQRSLPELIEPEHLRGDLHLHTTWSDGKAGLREMAEAGRALGYSYLAISDHSAYLGVTGGLDAERVRKQREEIEALNAAYRQQGMSFRLLQSCEVDILPDGSLALPDEVLAQLDLVIASPHVALRQERAQATERLIRAIRNPHVAIIGHPTGRLINQRAGAELDMEAVMRAAAETNTILEVNAGPNRLDLDAEYVRQAVGMGIKLAINSDAHHVDNLRWVELGVLTARRGWATPADVVNTWPLEKLRAFLHPKA